MIDNVKIAKAMSDPIRYKILQKLAKYQASDLPMVNRDPKGGICNCEFMEEFGLIQSRVSYHMKELTEAGLVLEEPRGKWRYYFLNSETLREYMEQLRQDFVLEGRSF